MNMTKIGLMEGETNRYYWSDNKTGKEVGTLYREIANVPLSDLFEDKFNLDAILGKMYVGDIMNFRQGAYDEITGKYVWYEDSDQDGELDDEITNSLEEVSSLDKATTDKVLWNGKLFIRATMPDGKQVWYDVLGLKL